MPFEQPGFSDLETTFETITSRMLSIYPHCHSIRIVGVGPDGEAVIPVPMGPMADTLERQILGALARFKPGEWIAGKELAGLLDKDVSNGHFRKTLARMSRDEEIESNKNLGYRLPQPK